MDEEKENSTKPASRKENDSPFGKNLKQIMEERGLTISATAEICGGGALRDWGMAIRSDARRPNGSIEVGQRFESQFPVAFNRCDTGI